MTKNLSRRQALILLGGASITMTVVACAKKEDAAVTPTPTVSDNVGVVGTNHGHAVTITKAQLTAAGALTLDIQGTSGHAHSVTLSATEVTSIKNGTKVSKDSSTGAGHIHTVSFN